jgi:hypothetical protein
MTASPSEIYRVAADQPVALTRLIAEAGAIAAAPVWLAGADPAIAAAMASMPPAAPGQVSGVVVTSTNFGMGACSEQMTYSYSGNGTPPKVSVSTSGNGCPAGSPFGAATNPLPAPPRPAIRPNPPRVIETAVPTNVGAAVQQVADLVKSAPPN